MAWAQQYRPQARIQVEISLMKISQLYIKVQVAVKELKMEELGMCNTIKVTFYDLFTTEVEDLTY